MATSRTTLRTAPTTRWAARLAAVVTAGGLTTAALVLTALVASAEPIKERTIKSECKDAGGTYSSHTSNGKRWSKCSYTDISGVRHDDHYGNGTFLGTSTHL